MGEGGRKQKIRSNSNPLKMFQKKLESNFESHLHRWHSEEVPKTELLKWSERHQAARKNIYNEKVRTRAE